MLTFIFMLALLRIFLPGSQWFQLYEVGKYLRTLKSAARLLRKSVKGCTLLYGQYMSLRR